MAVNRATIVDENFIQQNNLIEGSVLEYFLQTYYLSEVYCPSKLVIDEHIRNKKMIETALSSIDLCRDLV